MDPYRRYSRDPNPLGTASPFDPRSLLKELDYSAEKHSQIVEEIDRLFAGYGTKVVFGTRHRAPCSAWRAERVQLNDEALPRFVDRVHVFQQDQNGDYGRYVGYVSLRPEVKTKHLDIDVGFQYTTVAYVAPPQFMLRPRYHLITCVGGSSDGVMPFRCVPFCMVNEDAKNYASCLHASIHAAVLLKASAFGFTPISSQDMIALLWDISDGQRSMSDLARKGANLREALEVLEGDEVHAGGVLEIIPLTRFLGEDPKNAMCLQADNPEGARQLALLEAHRCMTDYLANGLPLILKHRVAMPPKSIVQAHAFMVFGMHLLHDPEDPRYLNLEELSGPGSREDIAELPGRFVIHDIRRGPFTELSAAKLLAEAWTENSKDTLKSEISFLAILPHGVKMGIYDARRLAQKFMLENTREFWQTYLEEYGFPKKMIPKRYDDMRYVTRLLRTGQVVERYLGVPQDESGSPYNEAINALRKAERKNTKQQYWWCVEIRIPRYGSTKSMPVSELLPGYDMLDYKVPPVLVYMWHIENDAKRKDSIESLPKAEIKHSRGRWFTLVAGDEEVSYEFTPYPS